MYLDKSKQIVCFEGQKKKAREKETQDGEEKKTKLYLKKNLK